MLTFILWIVGISLLLCILDLVFGNRLFPGKVGVVEINYFNLENNTKSGRNYNIYKYHRVWLFFKKCWWFSSDSNGRYMELVNTKGASPYDIAHYVNTQMRSTTFWVKNKRNSNCIPFERLDLAMITAKVFANKYKLNQIIDDRAEPVEIWNSKQDKLREELSEEDTLTLKLGEAIRDNNQVEVANITHELKEKKYI